MRLELGLESTIKDNQEENELVWVYSKTNIWEWHILMTSTSKNKRKITKKIARSNKGGLPLQTMERNILRMRGGCTDGSEVTRR